ncbi:MAG: prolipoprotein diacylglyceryl transferase [Fimbriimonadales bacterium]|nr:prolipoprotein diacylglyceryl transferase [Fimbriimonadales bacterium]
MHPILFEVFGLSVTTWGVMLLVGFIAAFFLVRARAAKFGIPSDKIIDLILYSMFAGIVGGRLSNILVEWETYSANPSLIWNIQEGGMTSFGGYLFGMAAVAIWAKLNKVSLLRTFDLAVAPGFLIIAIGRIGCFFNGCCYGGVCDLPWGVQFQTTLEKVHPAQLYDTVFALAAMAILLLVEKSDFRKHKTGPWLGKLLSIGLILMGGTRYLYELFRAGSSSEVIWKAANMTLAQMVAIGIALIGIAMYFLLPRKRVEAAE